MELVGILTAVSAWSPAWVLALITLVGLGTGSWKLLNRFFNMHQEAVDEIKTLNANFIKFNEAVGVKVNEIHNDIKILDNKVNDVNSVNKAIANKNGIILTH